ncbi:MULTISPECIES: MFS transporter [unclassified Lactobacillus]|uniref:MFS transporter n=1 Tax=unclassified Lactobacillus TaxID=2620435 RepID=UPI0018DB7E49|nr:MULTISPECIES: MFS transporter [unclassified Lactobacillus]MBH9989266.1 MFS transporter [Lactobacillus sp. M0392]MBI0023877.1 MFS transporter [Lactobacillus sp. W8171]MBI0044307.1 MFS transporter [Lactobacillus sp. M0393]
MLEKRPYLLSRLVSGLGNSLFGMVFIWWIQTQSKSSSVVGITNAIFTITAALSIFYGPFIDNHSFKKTSIYSMVIQVVLLFMLTAAMIYFSKYYAFAIIIAGLLSICDEFFGPADRAILKESVLDESEMTSIISQINIVDQLVNVGGTALSGALLAFLSSGDIILACSCLSLLGLLLLIRALRNIPVHNVVKEKENKDEGLTKYWQKILNGYRYIKGNSFLFHYLWSSVLYSFAEPALILILPRIAAKAGQPALYSTFYICILVGIILGAVIGGKMKAKIKTIGWAWIISAIPIIIMLFFLKNMVMLCILLFLFGPATSIHNVLEESIIQTSTSDNYLGRVLTTIRTFANIGGPISSVVAGVILDHLGEKFIVVISTSLIIIGGINILLSEPKKTN